MFPDKHFRDLESQENRRKLLRHAEISFAFITSFLLLGPIIHEFAHVILLQLAGCPYHIDLHFQFISGLYAEVQPLCYRSGGYLAAFYSVGYLSTFVTGWGFIVIAHRSRNRFYRYFAASGTGMLLSILLSIGNKGDVESFLRVAGIDQGLGSTVSVLVVLAVLLVSFFGVEMLLEG